MGNPVDDKDLKAAVILFNETKRVSTASLQRRMKIGLNKATDIMDELERLGVISESKGLEPRELLLEALPSQAERKEKGQAAPPATPTNPTPPKKPARKKPRKTEKKPIEKFLPVKLTERDKVSKAMESADATARLQELESEKKQIMSMHNEKVAEANATVSKVSSILRAGYEPKQVKCVKTTDYKKQLVTVVRLDTGKQVEKRPLNQEEQQARFNFIPAT